MRAPQHPQVRPHRRGYRPGVSGRREGRRRPRRDWASLCRRLISYQVGEGAARVPWPPGGHTADRGGGLGQAGRDLRRRPLDRARSDGHGVDGPMDGVEPLCASAREAHWHGRRARAVSERRRRRIRDWPSSSRPTSTPFRGRSQAALRSAVPYSRPCCRPGRQRGPWTHDGASPTIGPAPYSRFEPVAAPTVVPREAPKAGESLERIVIRSLNDDPDKDDDADRADG